MKKSELRQLIREEIKNLKEKLSPERQKRLDSHHLTESSTPYAAVVKAIDKEVASGTGTVSITTPAALSDGELTILKHSLKRYCDSLPELKGYNLDIKYSGGKLTVKVKYKVQ